MSRIKLKNLEQRTDLSRSTYDVKNDLEGLTNITNPSEIAKSSVGFEIKRKNLEILISYRY